MSTTSLNIRVDKTVKKQADEVFNELGINMTTAVNMFLRAVIRENGIPFALKLNTPDSITKAAIEEGKRIAYDDSVKGYSDLVDFKKVLEE
ncbi:MAG TPA: type II toxin-antitoxin system RelB/DinJ family antitoxin [Clostridia bacterium]|nr:type II toxin-antitoxin system RelB/DinJ family antitoxin [Clostridiaceae bacterium]HOF26590.1 type II toxin-antitoxin system RelB/DinJ family antitoxin [Clostridia bacterium]HOM34283.1 type II toxin-antitoxin system RelB/DinJ family antitoxin [Clostridia bacterium]HOR89412.1 type II toxin-antitoxin system RelB/DinJ family antitoxin [Clostridia bacterium]HOT70779.1 type II toxin-antitoxin system RelB/DinJ family antitoxin [Clostridia bacterium]